MTSKSVQRPHDPAAGGCGPSAQKARHSLIPGPNSEELGTPEELSLALEAIALFSAPGPQAPATGLWASAQVFDIRAI
eukprot:591956-Alexandrium_andersonii.AAC.1